MASYSMSVSVGPLAGRHDVDLEYRLELPNVDPERVAGDVVLVRGISELGNSGSVPIRGTDAMLRAWYARRFGAEVEEHDEAQRVKGHPERAVGDYYARVLGDYNAERSALAEGRKRRAQKPAPAYEYVVQVGSRDEHPPEAVCVEVYREWLEQMGRECPGMECVWAAVHVDEQGGPHMHAAFVPVGDSSRGLPEQVGWNRCLKRCHVRTKGELMDRMHGILEQRCLAHGIERRDMGQHGRERVTTADWVSGRAQEAAGAARAAQASRSAARAAMEAQEALEAARDAARAEAEEARRDAEKQRRVAGKLGPEGDGVTWQYRDGRTEHESSVKEVRAERDAAAGERDEAVAKRDAAKAELADLSAKAEATKARLDAMQGMSWTDERGQARRGLAGLGLDLQAARAEVASQDAKAEEAEGRASAAAARADAAEGRAEAAEDRADRALARAGVTGQGLLAAFAGVAYRVANLAIDLWDLAREYAEEVWRGWADDDSPAVAQALGLADGERRDANEQALAQACGERQSEDVYQALSDGWAESRDYRAPRGWGGSVR